nr:hypothetical protein [Tanacetum cinerariifolium]
MDMIIDQQVALDEALVPHASQLRIGKIINKCLSGKSTGYNSLRLSQAQILWGMYHKKNVDFAYLLWEDFVYQVEHKDAKKRNEMYYPQFTKVIVNFFITKDPSIPRRNKINWHYVRDDHMLTTIKLVLRHQNTQQFGAILPEQNLLRQKASVRRTQSSSDTTMPPPVAKGIRFQTYAKGKQPAKSSTAKGLTMLSKDDESYDDQEDNDDQDDKDDDQTDSYNDGDDFVHTKFSTHYKEAKDEESFDPIVQTPSQVENSDDEGNDDASHGMNVGGDEGLDAEDDDNELYGDLNINMEGRDVQMTDAHIAQVLEDTHVTLTPVNPDGIDSLFELTPRVDVPVTTTVACLLLTTPTLPPPSIRIISQVQQAPTPSPATAPSTSLQDLLNFGSLFSLTIDSRLMNLISLSSCKQISLLNPLQDEAQAENEDFLNKLDENIQKIIKEQVKEKVKTSYAVAADLSELELRKIIIEKIESNKYRDDEDKDEEPYAGSDRGSKRRRAGKEPELNSALKEKASKTFCMSTEGSKSHQKTASESALAEEPINLAKQADSRTSFNELMDTHVYFSTFLMNRLKVDTLNPESLAGPIYKLMKGSCKSLVELEFFLEEVYKATTDQLNWNNPEGQQYPHDLLKSLPLIPSSRGKLTNLTVKERFAFNVSLRMFTRSIVIQRHVEDLQLGVKSYQKKLNLTKPDTDGTLNDVRTALDDRLKGIRIKYLPQTIWRRSNKKRAASMIQAINKQLKTRRIMRSLEKFVGGRLYEEDFRMLQQTIRFII